MPDDGKKGKQHVFSPGNDQVFRAAGSGMPEG